MKYKIRKRRNNKKTKTEEKNRIEHSENLKN